MSALTVSRLEVLEGIITITKYTYRLHKPKEKLLLLENKKCSMKKASLVLLKDKT